MATYGVVISHEGERITCSFSVENDELAFQVAKEICDTYKGSQLLSMGCLKEIAKPIVIVYDFEENMKNMFSFF
jgi:hypothetical protein